MGCIVLFREVPDDNNAVVEHGIGGRYYRTTVSDIFVFAAVVKKEVGSVIFLKKCRNVKDPNAPCDLLSGSYQTLFYDSSGNDLTSAPNGIPTTLEAVADYMFYVVKDFHDGGTEADYFQPSFNPGQ